MRRIGGSKVNFKARLILIDAETYHSALNEKIVGFAHGENGKGA